MYLVLTEVSKKQEYIFRSNRLKENIGASFIVKNVTEKLPGELLDRAQGKEIFQGGGKNLFLINTEEAANNFIKEYSLKVLKKYSGIELFMVKVPFESDKDNIIEKIDMAYKNLAKKKSKRKANVCQLSFGVEKVCSSTGLSAVGYNKEKNLPISREIQEKLTGYEENSKSDYFKKLIGLEFDYSKEFDELIDSEDDKKYIGVVHIDGNKMGDKFQMLKDYYLKSEIKNQKEFNEAYLKELKKMSNEIADIYEKCFAEMALQIKTEEGRIPLRPLILAGDDISFVCDSKLSIKAVRIFLEKLKENHLDIGDDSVSLNACAGIAFVKSHYPFSKAYKLAEELCENGKIYIKTKLKKDASLIDWHMVQGEISGTLGSIRKKNYEIGEINLTLKPYIISSDEWNGLNTFKTSLEIIKSKDVPRSKMKTLREIYREGKEKTKIYMLTNGLEKVGKLSNKFDYINAFRCEFGFKDDYAVFYDAIEAMDIVEEI